MIPVTSRLGTGRLALLGRRTPRSRRRSPSTFCPRRRACSCSSIAIMRSNPREGVVPLFVDTVILFGFWIVFKNDSPSGNCLYSRRSESQVRLTLIKALQIACSPLSSEWYSPFSGFEFFPGEATPWTYQIYQFPRSPSCAWAGTAGGDVFDRTYREYISNWLWRRHS